MATTTIAHLPSEKAMKDNDVLCLFGVGDGIESLYAKLRSWLKKSDERYLLFIEEDAQLYFSARKLALAQDPQVRILFYEPGDVGVFLEIAWEFLYLKMAYIPAEGKGDVFFSTLDSARNIATLLASDWRDLGEKVLSNLIRNARAFPSSVLGPSLKDACKGVPAIVCAAGTSLDAAMPLLAELKDRALIIAGGSAISALSAKGIIPHLAAYIDPEPPRDRFLSQQIFETPFIYQNRFSAELLSLVHGQRIWMAGGGNYPIEEWLAQACHATEGYSDSGWTVATFCIYAALHLGCDPLILVGMDFCCSSDTLYAGGISGEENREHLISVVDAQGKQMYSKRDWLMSASWISAQAAALTNTKWINASEGILLSGVQKMPLADAVNAHLTESGDREAQIFAALQNASRVATDETRVDAVITELRQSFENALQLCNGLLAIWEKHFPHSPLDSADYALLQVELETEVCYREFLEPLWNMWKYPILRKEAHPVGKQLHRILFFKQSLETTNRRIFS